VTNQHEPHQPGTMSDEQRAAMRAAARRIDRVNEWLHVGGFIPAEEFQRCLDAGISHVIDLREEHELTAENSPPAPQELREMGIARRQVPVPNGSAPTREQLTEVADWYEAQEETRALYVHCGGGFARAATMTIGLLILNGLRFEEAFEQVRAARPEIILNEEQLAWLRSLEPGSR
jgi:protein-tyrosine phosphatase